MKNKIIFDFENDCIKIIGGTKENPITFEDVLNEKIDLDFKWTFSLFYEWFYKIIPF